MSEAFLCLRWAASAFLIGPRARSTDRPTRPASLTPRPVFFAEPDDSTEHGVNLGEPRGIVDDGLAPGLDQVTLAIGDVHRDLRARSACELRSIHTPWTLDPPRKFAFSFETFPRSLIDLMSPPDPTATGLDGLRVAIFEARMAGSMADLIRKQGGEPVEAPSLREVPIGDNPEAIAFADRLIAGEFDLVIFLTGVGTRYLAREIETKYPREEWVAALKRAKVAIRGPKPVAPLREFGARIDLQAPEPNTWRDLLGALDAKLPVNGLRVAVQEYGQPAPELIQGLEARGATVTTRAGLWLGPARGSRAAGPGDRRDRRGPDRRRGLHLGPAGGPLPRRSPPGKASRPRSARPWPDRSSSRRSARPRPRPSRPTTSRSTSSPTIPRWAISSSPSPTAGEGSARRDPILEQVLIQKSTTGQP